MIILRPHFGQVGKSLTKETPAWQYYPAEQHHARSRAAIDLMGNGHALAQHSGHRLNDLSADLAAGADAVT
jgi:hypothetical protein